MKSVRDPETEPNHAETGRAWAQTWYGLTSQYTHYGSLRWDDSMNRPMHLGDVGLAAFLTKRPPRWGD